MTLQSSGPISANDVNVEMGVSGTTKFDIDAVISAYSSNAILFDGTFYGSTANPQSMSEFYSAYYNQLDCFIAGTKIEMGDGTVKNIEDVEEGDLVIAYNPYTKIFKAKQVLLVLETLHTGEPDDLTIIIDFADGTQLHCTDSNPFWVPGKYWASYNPPKCQFEHNIATSLLEVGDLCISYDLEDPVAITAITVVVEPVQTHSMRVKEWSTFVANGIVSHNKCIHGDGSVEFMDGEVKEVRDVSVGDSVRVSGSNHPFDIVEEVELIEHDAIVEYLFEGDIKLYLTAGHPLKSSSGRYCALCIKGAKQQYGVDCEVLIKGMKVAAEDSDLAFLSSKLMYPDKKDTYIFRMKNSDDIIVNGIVVLAGIGR